MPAPAPEIVTLLTTFAPALTARTFANTLVLLYGALLAVGPRTVASALRAVGGDHDPHFCTYHRVLNRAAWSPLRLSRLLLGLIVATCLPPDAPLLLVVDETLERRRGRRIAWRSWFRDPVRSGGGQPVFSQGIRWLVLAIVVPVPWSTRGWALPVLTVPVLAPTTSAKLGKPHRTTVDRAQTLVRLVRRWQPGRELIVVGDGGFAATPLGHACRALPATTLVTRLRLDAALYDPPPPPQPGKRGPKPKKGARQPNLKARLADPATAWQPVTVPWYGGATKQLEVATGTALWHRSGAAPLPLRWVLLRDPAGKRPPTALCVTAPTAAPEQIVAWFVARWQIEVTFAEARAHLGIEAQRQWRPRAIGRTTPCLLGLFSLVVLLAQVLHPARLPTRQAAWYAKEEATFADALAAVRAHLRARWQYAASAADPDLVLIPRSLWTSLTDLLAYAA
jgi:DDE superfamily endonuclease